MVAEALWRSGLAEWFFEVGNPEKIEVEKIYKLKKLELAGYGQQQVVVNLLFLTGTHVFLNVTAKIYIRLCCEITKFAHC